MWAETYLIIIGNSNVIFPVSDKDVFEKPFLKYEKKLFQMIYMWQPSHVF